MEEKEEQLQQVSREREEFKAKLGQLQSLVTHYLSENQSKPQMSNKKPQKMLSPGSDPVGKKKRQQYLDNRATERSE